MAATMSKTVASGVHADGMDNQQRPDPGVPERPRPRSYSARYKAEILYPGKGHAPIATLAYQPAVGELLGFLTADQPTLTSHH